MYSFLKIRPN